MLAICTWYNNGRKQMELCKDEIGLLYLNREPIKKELADKIINYDYRHAVEFLKENGFNI